MGNCFRHGAQNRGSYLLDCKIPPLVRGPSCRVFRSLYTDPAEIGVSIHDFLAFSRLTFSFSSIKHDRGLDLLFHILDG